MKKLFLVALNLLILTSVVTAVYHYYIAELDSELLVECDFSYSADVNSVTLSCDVDDEDSIISDDYPLVLSLFDNDDSVVYIYNLEDGENEILLNSLDYNAEFSISIDGYNYLGEEFVSSNFYEYEFSTIIENLIIPSWVFVEQNLSDTEYSFLINLSDDDNCTTSVDITLYDSSNNVLLTHNYTDLANLEFMFTDLVPESQYYVDVQINYVINDFNQTEIILLPEEFITLRTLLTPSVDLINVFNNNINLTFDLIKDNKDATSVVYTIELIDLESNVLYSEITSENSISLVITDITGDYYISVKASYLFNGVNYNDVELAVYSIYNNALSNFFTIPTVNIVNTDLPLSNYDDYDDYIYTFFNSGVDEFTIYCEAPVDCSELVLNELYSHIPFQMTDLVHAYFDINEINFSYSSVELNFTLNKEYTAFEINQVDQEINNILNTIINESMTDYEKILAVHDYIINNAVYDSDCLENSSLCDNDHTAIGILFDGNAVCEGYAHTMDIMLRALRIPTFKISSEVHQWNAVYVDGEWYHLDATWDDPVSNNGSNTLTYNYFLVSSVELLALDTTDAHTYITTYVNFID